MSSFWLMMCALMGLASEAIKLTAAQAEAPSPVEIVNVSHEDGSTHSSNLPMWFKIDGKGEPFSLSRARLTIDGIDYTSQLQLRSDDDDWIVQCDPVVERNGFHTYRFTVVDTNISSGVVEWAASFNTDVRGAGDFVIELEDFDFDGGQTIDAASLPSYRGGGFKGYSPLNDIDFHLDFFPDLNETIYRGDKFGSVPLVRAGEETERSGYFVDNNWRLSWAGGDWYQYTRVFPPGKYRIFASMSFDGIANPTGLNAALARVTTTGSESEPTIEPLGVFVGPGTAGWGVSRLIELTSNPGGGSTMIALNGKTTLRFSLNSGEADYIVMVREPGLVITRSFQENIVRMTLSWSDDAMLTYSDAIQGPFTPWTLSENKSPVTVFSNQGQMMFFRLQDAIQYPPD